MLKFQKGSYQIVIGIIVLVLIVAGVWYYASKNAGEDTDAMMDTDTEMMDEGEAMMEDEDKDDSAMKEDGDSMMEKEGDSMADDTDVMKEKDGDSMMIKDETAALSAVGSYSGSGTAARSYDGKTFSHSVTASLGDPSEGKFYEGWLVKKAPSLTFFSTGRLVKSGDSYTLSFSSSENYPDYKDVVITEETASLGLDGNPEAHVLEGTF